METNHEDEGKGEGFISSSNISEHITFQEATNSATAARKGILNIKNEKQIENMKILAEKVFEPLRHYISLKRGKTTAIRINSFFRSEELNKVIGGSATSQHCNGQAIDISCNYPDFNNKDLFLAIRDKSAFDQLISEFPKNNIPSWVHVSFNKDGNRK